MYSFPNFEPVCCSMFNSNCCFLTCIQVSQETGKVVWYSHLLKNFPQFAVIHTVKVSETEVDIFLKFSCFFYDPANVGNLIFGPSAFSKSSLSIWKFLVHNTVKTLPGEFWELLVHRGKRVCQDCILLPAYLTYMKSTSCEMPGWMKYWLESRLPGKISITSDMQITLPLWHKAKRI